jgi:putative restriction endonuclease
VPAVVLESAFGSQYDDTPSSYEFPTRYLRFFEPLNRGELVHAVLYEPRGDTGHGRMAYVGLATISRPPEPTGRRSNNGEQLWRVAYDEPAAPFGNAIPREVMGLPLEALLRGLPRGRERNVATFGRAIRPIDDDDFRRILELGNAPLLETTMYPIAGDHAVPLTAARERTERLVAVIQRDALFRRRVLAAYGNRCSVSGFSLGAISPTKATGLLEAAHIRPVWQSGPDVVANGIPLTPTLHRLFDSGLFTIEYTDDQPTVRRSPRLEQEMISSPDRGFEMRLVDGLRLLVPSRSSDMPSPDQLLFHQRQIFLAS